MSYRHVALIGRARSGKDTIGARLGSRFAFVRVAFADSLRNTALALDPVVATQPLGMGTVPLRLSEVVATELELVKSV